MYVNVMSAVQLCISTKNVYLRKSRGTKHRASPPLQKVGGHVSLFIHGYAHGIVVKYIFSYVGYAVFELSKKQWGSSAEGARIEAPRGWGVDLGRRPCPLPENYCIFFISK